MIDLGFLARQTAGDAALEHELLALFLVQVDELRNRLAEGQEGGTGELAMALHRLRGAAVAVGASTMAETLALAEDEIAPSGLLPHTRSGLRAALEKAHQDLRGLIAALRSAGLAKAGESR